MIVFEVLVIWAWLASLGFALLYTRNRPWQASLPAKSAYTFGWIVAAVLTLVVVRVVFDTRLPSWLGFVVYAAIAVGSTFQLAVLIRTQRRDRRRELVQ